MIGGSFIANGSSADPSHLLRKLTGRGGKIDCSTKHTGVADGLTVVFFALGLGNAFHNRHRDLSLLNLPCCIGRIPQYTWARVPGSQPLSLCRWGVNG